MSWFSDFLSWPTDVVADLWSKETEAMQKSFKIAVGALQPGQGKIPGISAKAPTPQATEAQLARYKQEQRDLLRKRRASLATSIKLEEPKLGKQSLLGA